MKESALERHRKSWPNKSDEWLFERLENELKQKVETIHSLLNENKEMRTTLKQLADTAQQCDSWSSFQSTILDEAYTIIGEQ